MNRPLEDARARGRAEAVRVGWHRRRDEARARLDRLRGEVAELERALAETEGVDAEVTKEIEAARAAVRDAGGGTT